MRTMKVLLGVAAATLGLGLAWSPVAGAADLFSGPQGNSAVLPCAKASPCRLDSAITLAGVGDTVRMLPGEYYADPGNKTPWGTLPSLDGTMTLQGDDPADPPLIHGRALAQADPVIDVEAGSTLRDVHVDATSNASIYYAVRSSGTIDRSQISAESKPGVTAVACAPADGIIRNTVCLGRGTALANALSNGAGASDHFTLVVNVTAINTSASGSGITVGMSGPYVNTMNVSNSIARGPDSDLRVGTNSGSPVGTAVMNLEYSNWDTAVTSGMGNEQLLSDAGNQTGATAADPLFVNAASGDYRPVAGSPTIDAGLSSANLDPFTLGSTVRLFGSAVDIGANEYVPPPAVATDPATGVTQTAAVLKGSVNPNESATTVRFEYGPTAAYGETIELNRLAYDAPATAFTGPLAGLEPNTTYHFRLAASSNGGGDAASADRTFTTSQAPLPPPPPPDQLTLSKLKIKKKWRLKRGAVLRFRVSREARVKLVFDRRQKGKLRRRGVRLVNAKAGLNKVRLKKKLRGGKRMVPGRYRLSAVAVAPDGVRSAKRRVAFRVMR